jgi:hypothetical protein
MVVVYWLVAVCDETQATTAAAGSGRMSSDNTLVSRTII